MSNQKDQNYYRCLFFGMPCTFSAPVLAALRHPEIDLVGVVTPATRLIGTSFRIVQDSSPASSLPWQPGHDRPWSRPLPPRYLVKDMRDADLIQTLAALQPDLIIVACFPWLIPPAIVASARIAALNVHPSLLPRHGGPDPLFWTFHGGEMETGVTIHRLTNKFDAGPILLQAHTPILDDESLPSLDQRLAAIGAELTSILIEGLPELPAPPLFDPSFASYERKPKPDDLIVPRDWTVERARRFIAGVASSHGPLHYRPSSRHSVRIQGLGTGGDNVEIVLANGTLRIQPEAWFSGAGSSSL